MTTNQSNEALETQRPVEKHEDAFQTSSIADRLRDDIKFTFGPSNKAGSLPGTSQESADIKGLPTVMLTEARADAGDRDGRPGSDRGPANWADKAAAKSDPKGEVIYRWYGFGGGSGGREWHNVTRGEWERHTHNLALRETNGVIGDINRHSSGSDLRKDSEKLIKALEHAKEHLSKDEFDKLIKDLPGRTGNKVYLDGDKLKVNVPWAWSDPVVYDPAHPRSTPYNIRSEFPSIYDN